MNRANGPDAVARRSSWESIVVSAGSRPVLVGTLRVAVSATLLTGLLALGLLTSVSTVTAAPVLEASTPAGPAVATLLPTPSFPDLAVPQVPLPENEPEPVAYTCEPWADARMDDPAHPNYITNKNCPDLIAAKERAQREHRDSLLAEDHVVGDEREYTCSDPTSDVYGTAACGSDLDADGVIDGTAGSIGG